MSNGYLMSECKACYKDRIKKHNQQPEVKANCIKARKIWRQNNKERDNESHRNYYANHRKMMGLLTCRSQLRQQLRKRGIQIDITKAKYNTLTIKMLKQQIMELKQKRSQHKWSTQTPARRLKSQSIRPPVFLQPKLIR